MKFLQSNNKKDNYIIGEFSANYFAQSESSIAVIPVKICNISMQITSKLKNIPNEQSLEVEDIRFHYAVF